MENIITPEDFEPPIKFKLINNTRICINEHLDTISSDSSTQDGQDIDNNLDISNIPDLPLCTLNQSNNNQSSLKELLTNYIQSIPTLSWLPMSVSILSLAVTPDNSIPSHILLPHELQFSRQNLSRENLSRELPSRELQSREIPSREKPLTMATNEKSAINEIKFDEIKTSYQNTSSYGAKDSLESGLLRKRPRAANLGLINPLNYYLEGPNERLSKANLPKLLIVLDMDETLMHMHMNPQIHYDYSINLVEHSISDDPMFISCNIHPTMYISLRPGVQKFLSYLNSNSDYYEVALFTAGTQAYADAVMEGLDPNSTIIPPKNRHYRGSCELTTIDPSTLLDISLLETKIDPHGQPISFLQKDLNKLNWPLARTILLDNSLLSFSLHPDNGIWIKSYHPENSHNLDNDDNKACLFKLSQVMQLLETLKNANDVRPYLSNQFNLSKFLNKSIDNNNQKHNTRRISIKKTLKPSGKPAD